MIKIFIGTPALLIVGISPMNINAETNVEITTSGQHETVTLYGRY